MTPFSDAELEAMLADIESDRVERKQSFQGDAPNAVREAVCAFANDLPGHGKPGVAFVGVRDDGEPTGLPIEDQLLTSLGSIKDDGNIVPPPTLTVEKRLLAGSEMAVVTVAPSDSPPVRYKGRIWVRTGPRKSVATAQDERILNERRRHRDRPFDVRPLSGSGLRDLDLLRFREEYLPNAVASDVLEQNDRTLEQRLAATKMVASAEEPTATVLGLLVLGREPRDFLPGAWAQFLKVDGTDLSDPILDELALGGPVLDVIRRLEEKLVSHNRVSVDLTSAPVESRRAHYPMPALQQLIRNAMLHRNYEGTSAPVRVTWYSDRLEILSPGGPYGEVTATNFGTPGLADYRNPNLAEAMKVLGLVQRFGVGIAAARRALKDGGHPELDFEVQPGFVLARVRRSP